MMSLGLDFEGGRSDSLESLLNLTKLNSFNFLCSPLLISSESILSDDERERLDESMIKVAKWQNRLVAFSDLTLTNGSEWSSRILFKIPLDCEETVVKSLEYCNYLGVFGVLLELAPKMGSSQAVKVINLDIFEGSVYVRVNWREWSKLEDIRAAIEIGKKIKIGIVVDFEEFNPKVENVGAILERWKAERIEGIILDSKSTFIPNKNGYPVLPKIVQSFLQELYVSKSIPLIVSKSQFDPKDQFDSKEPKQLNHSRRAPLDYSKYLRWLLNPQKIADLKATAGMTELCEFAMGFENVLQTPLQPHRDHLSAEIYEVFERDPIKYGLYEEAITAALIDLVEVRGQEGIRVAVFGAGRGPLVQMVYSAAIKAKATISELIVVEKSPHACLTLRHRFKSQSNLQPLPTLIHADMRHLATTHQSFFESRPIDIIISELLGSFGDNELSPECLAPIERLLRPNSGVMIPQSYTSYLTPCYAPLLHDQVNKIKLDHGWDQNSSHDPFNFNYVTFVTRCYFPSTELFPVFTFEHPLPVDQGPKPPNLHQKLFFRIDRVIGGEETSAKIDGLIGYFEAVLYGDLMLSTSPKTASKGMLSWFPIYFPLKSPENINNGDLFAFEIERRTDKDNSRVWYQWRCIDSHGYGEWANENGKSQDMKL